MNKKKLVITIGLVFVFAMVAMVTNQQISNAQECKIIRIDEVKGSPEKAIRLDTEKLSVAKGTCVVWINWSGQLIKIVFKENAQKCSLWQPRNSVDLNLWTTALSLTWYPMQEHRACGLMSQEPLGMK